MDAIIMTCGYCRYPNSDEETRCRRCGRPFRDAFAKATNGSLAVVPQPTRSEAQPPAAVTRPPERPAATPRQALLFQEKASSKVIPFDGRVTPALVPNPHTGPPPAKTATCSPTGSQTRRPARTEVQPALEFLEPAPSVPRKLGTTVEAVIYCDAPVALPIHRACAAALDASMILIGCGFFLTTFYLLGGALTFNKLTLIMLAASAMLIAMFYGWIWVWSGRRTPGMRATRLTLINFDGYPPDRVSRWLRYLGACIGFCAGGLGVLWALLDEESLSWHDHISKTFPTFQVPETNFVRRR